MGFWQKKENKSRDCWDAVYRIGTDENKGVYATAFAFAFARKEGYTYLLTCNHVFDDLRDPAKAWVRLSMMPRGDKPRPFDVVEVGVEQLDIAVIRVRAEDWLQRPLLELWPESEPDTRVEIYGAGPKGRDAAEPVGRILDARVGKGVFFEAPDGSAVPGWELSIEKDSDFAKLKKGYSGGPLWDPLKRGVVGIVTTRWGEDKGYAVSVENLLAIWPEADQVLASHASLVSAQGSVLEPERNMVDRPSSRVSSRVSRGGGFSPNAHLESGEYQATPDHWVFKTLNRDQQITQVEKCWHDKRGGSWTRDKLICWFEAGTSDWHEALPFHLYLRLEPTAPHRCGMVGESCDQAVIECTVRVSGRDAVATSLRAQLEGVQRSHTEPRQQANKADVGRIAAGLLAERIGNQPLLVLHLLLDVQNGPWSNREIVKGGMHWIEQ